MSGDPIMPVHVRGGENVTSTHFTIEGPNECVLVFLTPASWHAMVERAASAKDITGHVNQTTRRRMLLAAERGLIRAFNLPDGWTP